MTKRQRDFGFISGVVLTVVGVVFGAAWVLHVPIDPVSWWKHLLEIINPPPPPPPPPPPGEPAKKKPKHIRATPHTEAQPIPANGVACPVDRPMISRAMLEKRNEDSPAHALTPEEQADPAAVEAQKRALAAGYGYGPGSTAKIEAPVVREQYEGQYTEQAKTNGISGIVVIILDVNEAGVPVNPCVKTGIFPDGKRQQLLGYGLDEEAYRTALRWRFHPGRRNGKPVTMTSIIEVHFKE